MDIRIAAYNVYNSYADSLAAEVPPVYVQVYLGDDAKDVWVWETMDGSARGVCLNVGEVTKVKKALLENGVGGGMPVARKDDDTC